VLRLIEPRLLRRHQFKDGLLWRPTMMVVEKLLRGAALLDLGPMARDALHMYRQQANQVLASVGPSQKYLEYRPSGQGLIEAACAAFNNVDRELVVLCAETSRLKLLAAVFKSLGSSSADTVEGPGQNEPVLGPGNWQGPEASSLHDTDLFAPFESSYEAFHSRLDRLHETGMLLDWARQAILPWEPLASFAPRLSSEVTDEEWEAWFLEPTLFSIVSELRPGVALVYPVFHPDWLGLVALEASSVRSLKITREECESAAKASGEWIREAGQRAAATFNFYGVSGSPVLVDWDPGRSQSLHQLAIGFASFTPAETNVEDSREGATEAASPAMAASDDLRTFQLPTSKIPLSSLPTVLPSARLLQGQVGHAWPLTVAVIGDAEHNLAGPWLEAHFWSMTCSAATTSMGEDATIASLVQALDRADLVVVGLHARTPRWDIGAALCCADGIVTFREVMTGPSIRAKYIVLSSCAAGTIANAVPEEMLGLATALLSAGARQVLAPSVPVNDSLAAILSILLGHYWSADGSLRDAWSRVGQHLEVVSGADLSTIEDVMRLPSVAKFPYPKQLMRRIARTPTSQLIATYESYLIYGS
jgi:hypothetical protein